MQGISFTKTHLFHPPQAPEPSSPCLERYFRPATRHCRDLVQGSPPAEIWADRIKHGDRTGKQSDFRRISDIAKLLGLCIKMWGSDFIF